MLSLKLFNVVIEKESKKTDPYISEEGYVIEPSALWAKDQIINFYTREHLNGNDLNKTFHKSWKTIKESSRFELLLHQITHYISTYGTNFQGEIYIPNEVLEIPDLKLKYKVIKGISKEELIQKCLGILQSGIALEQETLQNVFTLLFDELNYKFTGKENIKNKEAIIQLADLYNIYPENPVEFLRYTIYKSTGNTLLIKNPKVVNEIKSSNYNPAVIFNLYGVEKLASIFNRFKPLFLAFKSKCPKTINKISKLSKTLHSPFVSNPLNEVTSKILKEGDYGWLENATIYSLFKALRACDMRIKGQNVFLYKIRNGKSWVEESNYDKVNKFKICSLNYDYILNHIKSRINFEGKKFYIPEDIEYSIPTSEKMFVGNIPMGTKFYGDKLAVGIYWENGWGAQDLDLSALSNEDKVGWNVHYNINEGSLMYSGDITNAPKGAVEYLYAQKGIKNPFIIMNNVYYGANDCSYKIIIGRGGGVNKNYMMDPNKLFADIKCVSIQKQTILGILIPDGERQSFVVINIGGGNVRVSNSELSNQARISLIQEWSNPLSFNKIITLLGAQIVKDKENADVDLSLDNLEKDTFIKIFN